MNKLSFDKHADCSPASIKEIDAVNLKILIADFEELALIDVREKGVHSKKNIFYSISVPLSHFEQKVGALIPRRSTRVVLIDDDDGLAVRAGHLLTLWGYTDVSRLSGGVPAWEEAGFQVFAGVYVSNKAFGEYIEHHYHTPHVDATTLEKWMDEKKDMLILDSRPYEEFQQISLPGGLNCPGAELVYRAFSLVESPSTTIVVNCAGRTRGIIGAQSLINAGIPNPVVTLKDGTAGWYLNGGTLREGSTDVAPLPTAEGLRRALLASEKVARRFKVQAISYHKLQSMLSDSGRNTFVLDVRTPEEYKAGHLAGSRNAPGGQVIQSTEHYVGVLRARIVLVDDKQIRARLTASWLIQLGWKDVYVLEDVPDTSPDLEYGSEVPIVLGDDCTAVPHLDVAAAHTMWQRGSAVFYDFENSLSYKRGHIPGAWFAVRSRIRLALPSLLSGKSIIVTSADGTFARYAAIDLINLGIKNVFVLCGGTAAWSSAGLPLTNGLELLADSNDDIWYAPYDSEDRVKAMTSYLAWELGLVAQVEKEGSAFLTFSHEK